MSSQSTIERAILLGKATVGETAKGLGLSGPWTVRRLEQRGVLPAVRRSLAHAKL